MKKSIQILLLVLFPSLFLSGQKVVWSIPQKIKGRIVYTQIIGGFENNYYITRFDKKTRQSFIIEKYIYNMKFAGQYSFRIEKNTSVEKITLLNKNILIFYSQYIRKEKIYKLYCHVLNENLNLIRKGIFIASSQVKFSGNRIFSISPDFYNDRILVTYPIKQTDKEIFYKAVILDAALNHVLENTYSLFSVDNDHVEEVSLADYFVLYIIKLKHSKLRSKMPLYSMVYFDLKNNLKRTINLFNDSIQFNSYVLKFNPLENNILISGFISYLNNSGSIGIGAYKIEPEENKGELSLMLFDREMISRIMGSSRSYEEVKNYFPRDVIFRSDGGYNFIAEYFHVEKEVYTDYYNINHTYVKYFYRFSDIVVFSISPQNQIDWYRIIHKDQVSLNDEGYYSSFIHGSHPAQLVFVYNNMERSNWNLMIQKIKSDGSVSNDILVKSNEFDGLIIPKLGKQVSENELILPAYSRKKGFQLLKIML